MSSIIGEMVGATPACSLRSSVTPFDFTSGAYSTSVRELTALVAQDRDLMVASRRWRPGHPNPELFWPGDVVALRALAVYGTLREADVVLNPRLAALAGPADEATRSALQGLLSYARLLYRAQPFFLPAATAVGLMASHPPDEAGLAELRLPFASVAVYFGADLHAGEDTLIWPPETLPRLAEAKASIPDVGLGAELGQTIVLNLARLGSYASGVVLFSRPDGGLADEMLWLLATDPDPDSADASLDRLRAVLPAYRSRATLAPWWPTSPPPWLGRRGAPSHPWSFRPGTPSNGARPSGPASSASSSHKRLAPRPCGVNSPRCRPRGMTTTSIGG